MYILHLECRNVFTKLSLWASLLIRFQFCRSVKLLFPPITLRIYTTCNFELFRTFRTQTKEYWSIPSLYHHEENCLEVICYVLFSMQVTMLESSQGKNAFSEQIEIWKTLIKCKLTLLRWLYSTKQRKKFASEPPIEICWDVPWRLRDKAIKIYYKMN